MKGKTVAQWIRDMPRGAYIFLRSLLALCCAMLFISFVLFLRFEQGGGLDRALYLTAVTMLETPAALLLLGGVGLAILIDHSPSPPK